ncbi:MAG TPA: hypothetical protein VFP91_15025 [Vicinamibacterales bacterium]|nr:hypothetical protein [Vicinamibacterales bacterium]
MRLSPSRAAAAIALCVAAAVNPAAQSAGPADTSGVPELLKNSELFSTADIVCVLEGSDAAMSGREFRVTFLPNAGTKEMKLFLQMGDSGWPRYLRFSNVWSDAFYDYTGKPAYSCRGELLSGEFTIDYSTVHDGLNPVSSRR